MIKRCRFNGGFVKEDEKSLSKSMQPKSQSRDSRNETQTFSYNFTLMLVLPPFPGEICKKIIEFD